MTTFNGSCDTCARPMMQDGCTTGYGVDDLARRHCFMCCADHDKAFMRARGRIALYLIKRNGEPYHVTNWPGSFELPSLKTKVARRANRVDAWFMFEGRMWHGFVQGDTDLLHCKQLKEKRV